MNEFFANQILFVVPLLCAIPVHEFGHWLGFWYYGYKPKIRITKFGVTIGEGIFYKLKVRELIVISLLGILFGYMVVGALSDDPAVIMTYFLMCSLDLANLVSYSYFGKDMYLVDVLGQEYEKAKKQVEE